MEEIKKWQNMWQERKSKKIDLSLLINSLNHVEKRAKKQRWILMAASTFLVVYSVFHIPAFNNLYYALALILMGIAVAIKLVLFNRSKYEVIRSEAVFDNRRFIEEQINSLHEKMAFDKKHLIIYLLLLLVALNSVLLGLHTNIDDIGFDFNGLNRVVIHLLTFVLVAFGYLVNSKRMARMNEEALILIEKLKRINKDT